MSEQVVMPRVYNKRHGDAPEDAVYVGRPSPYGNPYRVSDARTRENAVEQYRMWIYAPRQRPLRELIRRELRDKDLVCWCAPSACHADVILEIANGDGDV